VTERHRTESEHEAGVYGGADERGVELSPTVVFGMLSNPRRRCVLHYLKRNDGVTSVGGMARAIAAWEEGIEEGAVTPAMRKRVYTSLYQVHLPKMDEAGFLSYDRQDGSVTLRPAAARLDVHMEVATAGDIPWSQFYLGLSAVFTAVAATSALAVAPMTVLSPAGWSVLFAVLFLGSSAIHVYRDRGSSIWAGDRPAEMTDPTDGEE
jgi:hypothetical protein